MGTKKDFVSIMCDKTMTSILNNTNGVMHVSYKIQYESASHRNRMVIFDFEDDDDRVVVISLLNYSLYYKLMHTM
jgi:hypothetical protein